MTTRPDAAACFCCCQVPAGEVTALLGAGVAVGGSLRAPPSGNAGSAEFVRGRVGAATPFAPGGEPLARQPKPSRVSDAQLADWLAVRPHAYLHPRSALTSVSRSVSPLIADVCHAVRSPFRATGA
jgi:hypothetical protein